MGRRTCLVFSTNELSPRAFEALKSIKQESGYGDVQFVPVKDGDYIKNEKILVFGSVKPNLTGGSGVEYIHTYSIPQIMSKPNAFTVVRSALDLVFAKPHEVPAAFNVFAWYSGVKLVVSNENIDYSLPTAIDIETSGNLGKTHTPEDVELLTVAIYQGGHKAHVFSGMIDPETGGTLPMGKQMLKELAEFLPKFEKAIYHNGKFDTRVLNRVLSKASGTAVKLKVWFDTMLAHHVLNHAAGMHGLKPLCQMYFGAEEWEADLKNYTKGGGHYELIPNRKLTRYNGYDVYWTYVLWQFLEPQIDMDENNQTAFMLEMQAADMLLDVEMTGIPFHDGEAQELLERKQAEADAARESLELLTGIEKFNPNSPKQVKEALEKMDIFLPSTAVGELEKVRAGLPDESGASRFIDNLLVSRKANKIIGTYVNGWSKHARNGRVHPTFLVHGTSTGRLSSSAPNAQNVPRDKEIRKIVTLNEGNSLG